MTLIEPGIKTKERSKYFEDLRHLLIGSFEKESLTEKQCPCGLML
jgi:hypothetical protein